MAIVRDAAAPELTAAGALRPKSDPPGPKCDRAGLPLSGRHRFGFDMGTTTAVARAPGAARDR